MTIKAVLWIFAGIGIAILVFHWNEIPPNVKSLWTLTTIAILLASLMPRFLRRG
jgi:hypothetical protein